MANALITGASGFIGAHLAARLVARGDRVTCLVRPSSNLDRLRPLGVEFASGDVTEPESLLDPVARADVVYHLAGLTKALRKDDLTRVNEGGTRNLAAAAAARNTPPLLLVVSSLAAAGPAPNGRLRTEADPAEPVSNYGRSKRAGELAAESYADRLAVTVVRPPIVFGEGDRETLHMVRPIARFGMHAIPGFTERRFSIVYAGDLADGIVRAADRGTRLPPPGKESGQPGEGCYFIACDEHPSYADLGLLIRQALGPGRFHARRMPEFLVWTAAAATQCVSFLRRKPGIFNLDKAREAVAGSWLCSSERAKTELGYRPSAPLVEQLRVLVNWYREQKWI
jgi:nucleoside-diphosphate-sugar epimerase